MEIFLHSGTLCSNPCQPKASTNCLPTDDHDRRVSRDLSHKLRGVISGSWLPHSAPAFTSSREKEVQKKPPGHQCDTFQRRCSPVLPDCLLPYCFSPPGQGGLRGNFVPTWNGFSATQRVPQQTATVFAQKHSAPAVCKTHREGKEKNQGDLLHTLKLKVRGIAANTAQRGKCHVPQKAQRSQQTTDFLTWSLTRQGRGSIGNAGK